VNLCQTAVLTQIKLGYGQNTLAVLLKTAGFVAKAIVSHL